MRCSVSAWVVYSLSGLVAVKYRSRSTPKPKHAQGTQFGHRDVSQLRESQAEVAQAERPVARPRRFR